MMTNSGTRTGAAELLVRLDRSRHEPMRVQLERALRDMIRSRALQAGTALPSSRVLAVDLDVSRRLVVEAYQQLTAEGYLITANRTATLVADVGAPSSVPSDESAPVPRYDLRPRVPALDQFPRSAWIRAYTNAVRSLPAAALDYPDPRGVPELRHSIANYLRRVRAVAADPDHVVICAGFTQALSLLTSMLNQPLIAVEDPGVVRRDRIIAAAGGTHLPVEVDEHGVQVDHIIASDADAAVVTPTHQFPLGVALSRNRRAELLAWARDGHLIIEDDYDAEYRYDRPPVGALQGLAPANTAYIGTVSKTLAPALRLGWIVAPAALIDPLAEAKRDHDAGHTVLDQHALAQLIDNRGYERHLRRVRLHHRQRRDQLLASLHRHLPQARISGMAAGLHLVIRLPAGADAASIVANAAERDLSLAALNRYRLKKDTTGDNCLVVGYGNITTTAIETAIQHLAESIAAEH